MLINLLEGLAHQYQMNGVHSYTASDVPLQTDSLWFSAGVCYGWDERQEDVRGLCASRVSTPFSAEHSTEKSHQAGDHQECSED